MRYFLATFCVIAYLLAAPTLAAGGYWIFDSYSEQIPPPKCQGQNCTVSAEAKAKGARMDIACTDISGKPYGYHGHFAWTYQNLGGTLLPGQKVDFQGTVTNLSGKDSGWTGTITQGSNHPNSGSVAILGTNPALTRKAGSSAAVRGTWTVPQGPPTALPDGHPAKMVLAFSLSYGGGAKVSKYFLYRWQTGQPAPSRPLPSEAGTAPPAQSNSILDSFNGGGVGNSPSQPATFTVNAAFVVTEIQTYHWNNGQGTAVGRLALRDQGGRVFGPWNAIGTPGQGGVPNAFWTVHPGLTLPPGTYTVVDSEPATWSTNAAAGNRGFVKVLGTYPTK